jgi:hypothetical protein
VPDEPSLEELAAPSWASLRTTPEYVPELLALAAVSRLGPQIRDHTAWLRDTYPGATSEGLARLATQRLVRQARNQGAITGLAGALTVLVDVAALAWTQASLVLHVAAAYGRDPADPQRAAELLVLWQVHPSVEAGRLAVDAAHDPQAHPRTNPQSPAQPLIRLARPAYRLARTGVLPVSVVQRAARLVPGAGAVVGALADARSVERLAARAVQFYR